MIKKFNQFAINEEVNPYVGMDKIKMFYDDMKKLVDYDEDEYEQGDEPSPADFFSEVGDLMDKYLMSISDLQEVVKKYPNDIDVNMYVKGQLEYEIKEKEKKDTLNNLLKKHGVTDVDDFKRDLRKIGYGIYIN